MKIETILLEKSNTTVTGDMLETSWTIVAWTWIVVLEYVLKQKCVHIVTSTARERNESVPQTFFLENLLSKEGESYEQGMDYKSHKIKLGIRCYSKLLRFC